VALCARVGIMHQARARLSYHTLPYFTPTHTRQPSLMLKVHTSGFE